jgi:hypothetical protein
VGTQFEKNKNKIKNQNQNILFYSYARSNELTCDLGNLWLRPARFKKQIGTKHEKYLMLIFNPKVKIIIKKTKLEEVKKKKQSSR